jgi:hypothetical protein
VNAETVYYSMLVRVNDITGRAAGAVGEGGRD